MNREERRALEHRFGGAPKPNEEPDRRSATDLLDEKMADAFVNILNAVARWIDSKAKPAP